MEKCSNICYFSHTDREKDTPRLNQFVTSFKKEIHAVLLHWLNLRLEDKQCPLMENINYSIICLKRGWHSLIKVSDCVPPLANRLTVSLEFQKLVLSPTLVSDDLKLDLDKRKYFYHFVPP